MRWHTILMVWALVMGGCSSIPSPRPHHSGCDILDRSWRWVMTTPRNGKCHTPMRSGRYKNVPPSKRYYSMWRDTNGKVRMCQLDGEVVHYYEEE